MVIGRPDVLCCNGQSASVRRLTKVAVWKPRNPKFVPLEQKTLWAAPFFSARGGSAMTRDRRARGAIRAITAAISSFSVLR
jgi:hypothetical protein